MPYSTPDAKGVSGSPDIGSSLWHFCNIAMYRFGEERDEALQPD
jgi:hypothetical protein